MRHHSCIFRLCGFVFIPCVLLSLSVAVESAVGAKTKGLQFFIKDRQGKQVGLYGESHALLIGVSQYTAGWPKLESVPHEIERVDKALQQQGFNVKRVMDPDSDELFSAFDDFIDAFGYDTNNRLLFFYSGHGYNRKQGNKGYLVPTDAPDPRYNEKGFLRKSVGMGQILT